MSDQPARVRRVPVFYLVMAVVFVVTVAAIIAAALWWSHYVDKRRDANCDAWEWVLDRADDPDDPRIPEFVKFLNELGCDITVGVD